MRSLGRSIWTNVALWAESGAVGLTCGWTASPLGTYQAFSLPTVAMPAATDRRTARGRALGRYRASFSAIATGRAFFYRAAGVEVDACPTLATTASWAVVAWRARRLRPPRRSFWTKVACGAHMVRANTLLPPAGVAGGAVDGGDTACGAISTPRAAARDIGPDTAVPTWRAQRRSNGPENAHVAGRTNRDCRAVVVVARLRFTVTQICCAYMGGH